MAEILRDLPALLKKLEDIPKGASARGGGPLESAMRKGAKVWVDAAQSKVSGLGPGVKNSRTGNVRLSNSIKLRKDPDPGSNNADVRFEVGYAAKAFWGAFVELGTEKQQANPFLRPAFDESEDRILKVIGEELTRSIERAVK